MRVWPFPSLEPRREALCSLSSKWQQGLLLLERFGGFTLLPGFRMRPAKQKRRGREGSRFDQG